MLAVLPLQKEPTPCSAETRVKQFKMPVYLGISPETILGFASCGWIKSLTLSIGAVAVFAMEPDTPPAAKSFKKPSGSYFRADKREKSKWVSDVTLYERGKKKNPDLSNRPAKLSQRSTTNPPSSTSRASTVAPIPSEKRNDGVFLRASSSKTNPSKNITTFGGPKNRSEASHKSSHAKRFARRRARVQIAPASRKNYFLARFARTSRKPSVRSLPRLHLSTKSSRVSQKKRATNSPILFKREDSTNVTHHFFLTVRGEHRGRQSRALRVRHRRRHSHIIRSNGRRRRRRLRFQVAFERLLVKGFRDERHLG